MLAPSILIIRVAVLLMELELYGTFYCARVAARAFIKQGVKGSIVFTASMASYRPNKACAFKMVRSLRKC